MDVIVIIEGREAIPVRALPYVTGWTMSPDVVANSLARTAAFDRLEGVKAYHLSAHGVAPMLPKEWDGIEADLAILTDKLKATETIDQENYPAWRREAITLLPPACFAWRDEFEPAFLRAYSPQRYHMLEEREGDRELNFMPRVPADLAAVVMEGFESVEKKAHGTWPWGNYETPLLRILAGAVERWCVQEQGYPQKKTGLVQEWLEGELEKAGLPISKALIDHIETIISPRVYSHTRQRVKRKH
jgi:hypothetical protein